MDPFYYDVLIVLEYNNEGDENEGIQFMSYVLLKYNKWKKFYIANVWMYPIYVYRLCIYVCFHYGSKNIIGIFAGHEEQNCLAPKKWKQIYINVQ